uniref:Predicted P-loop ATPase, KAP-like n=1 Tax=Candidatus Kentrum sp. FM TaxID=2126340 RepID=A0A450VMQ5_9GAMM|nr:MAG: Predicted P-loop ATPase, KAP-like [Candidatus Kentron sp. FM]VFJ43950.1 MAG: Predicted P-loop ATPase, KAP-like [Candidatus Kentron sp. FM]VFK06031.1 MAG: Predicted P-loop ATPase, KAP-like [Candidatus Kentron sp. FM]
MWSDNQTDKDFLNFAHIADTAAELIIKADGQPLSMGVSGGWGIGKSSMLSLISSALKSRDGDPYIFVEFNAWLYQGYDDARAALLDVIARELISHAEQSKTGLEKAKEFLRRVNWLRIAGMAARTGLSIATGAPPVDALGTIWTAAKGILDGNAAEEDAKKVQEAGKTLADESGQLLKPLEETSPPQQIQDLRDHFQNTLEEMGVTLVVFIDDLDRCLPPTSIATLEAIRLFLFLPNTAFVIAADDRMIRQAVRAHFHGTELDDDLVTNYFDKLIQIPLRVPPLGTQDVRAYMMLLYVENSSLADDKKERIRAAVCKQLSESWRGKRVDARFMAETIPDCPDDLKSNLDLADRLAPLMSTAKQIAGNPRLIKRFLNTLSIRMSIARSQGVSLDEAALAKMLLFERCADEAAYSELLSNVNESETGKPSFLADWERKAISGEELDGLKDLGTSWNSDFIRDWLALEPSLADMDLRAIVYVSREHMPLITPSDQMSSEAAGIMEALLGLTKKSPPLSDQVRSLPGKDISLIMDRLLARARQENQWGTTPNVLFAILTVIDADASHGSRFAEFLKQIPVERLKPAIVESIRSYQWAKDVLDKWKSNESTSKQVKNAINALSKNK